MQTPAKYHHVFDPGAPRTIQVAASLLGTKEKPGGESNPAILKWAAEVERAIDAPIGYSADSIPWCGLFAALVATRAGWAAQTPKQPLWARNWRAFGVAAERPAFGDVLVFSRGSAGHVGFYVGEGPGVFYVIGGNQGDAVSIVAVEKSRLLAARRPRWRVGPPPSRQRIWLGSAGIVSRDEA
ncbi:TIGR02594 family protein [Methylocystis parvus]|uniref:TIGR02594 family protein n=1 Tax=Methylocystis parvus TaxID=134 RepID=UPI003C72A924